MPKRDRFQYVAPWIAVAVGLLLLVPSSIWLAYRLNYDDVYQQYATEQAGAEARSEFERRCAILSTAEEVVACFNEQVESARETHRAEEDVKAQKQMAAWALALLIVSGGLGVGSLAAAVVGVVLVRDTLLETRRIGQAQTRAYLGATDVEIRETNSKAPHVVVTLKNAGASPAYKVIIRSGYVVNFTGPPVDNLDRPREETARGFDIGPGQTLFHPIYMHELMWSVARASLRNGTGRVFAFGKVDYEDAFDRKQSTRFRFEFFANEDTGIRDGKDFTITGDGNEST